MKNPRPEPAVNPALCPAERREGERTRAQGAPSGGEGPGQSGTAARPAPPPSVRPSRRQPDLTRRRPPPGNGPQHFSPPHGNSRGRRPAPAAPGPHRRCLPGAATFPRAVTAPRPPAWSGRSGSPRFLCRLGASGSGCGGGAFARAGGAARGRDRLGSAGPRSAAAGPHVRARPVVRSAGGDREGALLCRLPPRGVGPTSETTPNRPAPPAGALWDRSA